MAKPEFKQISPFKVSQEEIKNFAEERNIPTTVFPKKAKPTLVKAPETPKASVKFTFDIPEDLMLRMKQRALDERRTIRSLVLQALAQYGIEVRPEDMVDDRRRRNLDR